MGKRTELTTKQRLFVDALPNHNWDILNAGLAAGYTKMYAGNRLASEAKKGLLAKAIEAKITKVQSKSKVDLDTLAGRMDELYLMCVDVGDKTNAKGALDSLIRMQGGFIDRSHNINAVVDVQAPLEPVERKQWLLSQLALIDRQLSAGTAIAGDEMLSFTQEKV